SSYAKVRQIKILAGKRPVDISVDGGVNSDKAGRLAQAGASVLVAGSAIFGAQDAAQAVKDLRSASDVSKQACLFPPRHYRLPRGLGFTLSPCSGRIAARCQSVDRSYVLSE